MIYVSAAFRSSTKGRPSPSMRTSTSSRPAEWNLKVRAYDETLLPIRTSSFCLNTSRMYSSTEPSVFLLPSTILMMMRKPSAYHGVWRRPRFSLR